MAIPDRLERLQRKVEELAPAAREWTFEDQREDVFDKLCIHRIGGTRYEATDREIVLLAMWCTYEDNSGENWEIATGEVTLPHSGAVLRWHEDREMVYFKLDPRGATVEDLIEDLPEHVRSHVQRMPLAEQREREWWLYNYWLQRKAEETETRP